MEYHKKLGMIVMVLSMVFLLLFIALSESICYGDFSGMHYVITCLYISLFEDIPGNHLTAVISIPLKYLFVFCGLMLGLGFLLYKGAIKAPEFKMLLNTNSNS